MSWPLPEAWPGTSQTTPDVNESQPLELSIRRYGLASGITFLKSNRLPQGDPQAGAKPC
ncbi:protein of unknown function [Pseudomonas inefficax]|uniref:Uncharacterized protein n=1 Tax=Pseudomonas inefficax TaxID=2078786 RepID=A0AAQ1PDJ4_9PSED|nr:protein of unknown function [Pseudomonas inefficax]